MKNRFENRKTLSFTNYEYVSLRCKDISAVEGKSDSMIIEEIIMGKRPPLVPRSETASSLVLRNYLDDDACTKILKEFFGVLSGRCISYIPKKEKVMVDVLHTHICFRSVAPIGESKMLIELIGINLKAIKDQLEHHMDITNSEIQKLSGHIDSPAAALAYSENSDHRYRLKTNIDFVNSLIDYFVNRNEFISYSAVTQLILTCWEYIKTNPATYSVLSMIAQIHPVTNIPENRYNLYENLLEACSEWDFQDV